MSETNTRLEYFHKKFALCLTPLTIMLTRRSLKVTELRNMVRNYRDALNEFDEYVEKISQEVKKE